MMLLPPETIQHGSWPRARSVIGGPIRSGSALVASFGVVPILMTTLSAGLALVPLALSGAHPGAELEAPMAVVILFGLLSATALNMIVVPIAYLRFRQKNESGGVRAE